MIDDACIQGIALGNSALFGELFASWSAPMYYYAMKITGDQDLSKDVIQESFIAFWNKRASFDNTVSVKAFLYATIKYQVCKHSRDASIHKRLLAGLPAEAGETDNLIIVAEVNRQVREAVAGLPGQTRGVIERSMNGMKTGEIARDMDISINTVKTLKKNGYKTLRARLGHLQFLVFLAILAR
jgi:RNA polymerase sigma-70 factor (ECF subfamily)